VGRYGIPMCGGTGGPTGLIPGPGCDGRAEPAITTAPGYKHNIS